MAEAIAMRPIGWVRGGRIEAIDDDWGGVEAEIALDPAQFTAECAGAGPRRHRRHAVLDLKPVMAGFLPRGALRQPEWASALMQGYW